MIPVDFHTIVWPGDLIRVDSKLNVETHRAIEFFALKKNQQKRFSFRAYRDKTLQTALNSVFQSKCAYCESFYGATQPMDIEHYRPKSIYYWLAADLGNLLPSCVDCNRERYHDYKVGLRKSGKGTHFPIANPARRAAKPGEESREKRLLLHPYLDQPKLHLEFVAGGVVRSKGKPRTLQRRVGKTSIDVYGLNRPGLVQARRARLIEIHGLMKRIGQTTDELRRNWRQPFLRKSFVEDWYQLDCHQLPSKPYSLMARQMILRFQREFWRRLKSDASRFRDLLS